MMNDDDDDADDADNGAGNDDADGEDDDGGGDEVEDEEGLVDVIRLVASLADEAQNRSHEQQPSEAENDDALAEAFERDRAAGDARELARADAAALRERLRAARAAAGELGRAHRRAAGARSSLWYYERRRRRCSPASAPIAPRDGLQWPRFERAWTSPERVRLGCAMSEPARNAPLEPVAAVPDATI